MGRLPKTPSRHALVVASSALLLLASAIGCKPGGRLVLQLERPQAGQDLDPLEDQRLDHFALIITDPDGEVGTINTVTFKPTSRSLDIGDVPTGFVGNVTLVGYSATNQVLAWAETGPLDIESSDELSVSLAVRKPFTYVAGGPTIQGFDTTKSNAADQISGIGLSAGHFMDIASTPDGRYLLAVVGDFVNDPPQIEPSLQLFSTASHQPASAIPLAFKPGYLSLSPTGRWAVVSEYQQPDDIDVAQRVAVIDVEQALNSANPADAARIVNMANASRVAFVQNRNGVELAVILRAPLNEASDCAYGLRHSTLSTIRLDTGTLEGEPVDLGTYARDIASNPDDSRVFVADPCNNRVALFDVNDNAIAGFPWTFQDTKPFSVLVSGTRLYIGAEREVPVSSTDPAPLVVHTVDPYSALSSATPSTLEVPYLNEAVVVQTAPGAQVLVDILPYRVRAYRLSVPPGENRLSVLVLAEYHSDPITLGVAPNQVTITQRDIASASYIGLDTSSGEIRRRYRARCIALEDGQSAADPNNWHPCAALAPHEEPAVDFFPRGATSIYGVP